MNKPIKRHESLQPISREHHFGLLICWKIREGLKRGIEPQRIKQYTGWCWQNHLIPHFTTEEQYLFPILGNQHDLVKKALSEHRKLKKLFEKETDIITTLSLIEEKLESHIRFEERILFNVIQDAASEADFKRLNKLHSEIKNDDDWEDKFWETN